MYKILILILILIIIFIIYLIIINTKSTTLPTTTSTTTLPTTTSTSTTLPTTSKTILNLTSIDTLQNCRLPRLSDRNDVAIGFPSIPERLNPIGNIIAKVIFVDFPDAIATKSPKYIFSVISLAPMLFTEMSYGNMNLILEPTYTWYRMSKISSSYAPLNASENHRPYIHEAINLVKSDIDFSNADTIIIMSNPDAVNFSQPGPFFVATDGNGFTLNGKYISNIATSGYDINNWGFMWLNHELGHGLGLPDLYAFIPVDGNGHPYVGGYSYMGLINGNSPGLFAWERWLLGWLNSDQLSCYNISNGIDVINAFLTPIERIGGLKAVMISISPSKVLMVECRRKEGIDRNMIKPGILIYIVDSSISTGAGPIQVYTPDNSDPLKLYSTIAVGENVSTFGLNIKVLNSTNEGDSIEISNS